MDGVQLSQGYRAIYFFRLFTFYHQVFRNSWYSSDQPRQDERLSQPWSHPVALNMGPLNWEFSTLTARSLLHEGNYSFSKTGPITEF